MSLAHLSVLTCLVAVFAAMPARSQDSRFPPGKSIVLPQDVPFLPAGPGRDAFVSNCVICHSPRYVVNQPLFPRNTWMAEVTKMIKVYGAPIAAQDVAAITDYLVHFHGQETGQP